MKLYKKIPLDNKPVEVRVDRYEYRLVCDECEEHVKTAVEFGNEGPDNYTCKICLLCLNKAVELINNKGYKW